MLTQAKSKGSIRVPSPLDSMQPALDVRDGCRGVDRVVVVVVGVVRIVRYNTADQQDHKAGPHLGVEKFSGLVVMS